MKRTPSIPILLFLIINTWSLICIEAQSRASFGEPCDKLNRCDSKSSLTCSNNGTCICVKETEMTFDEDRSKCVVLSGERCSYTAIEILTDTTQEKRYSEKLDCVTGATCSSDGYCACDSTYFETVEGHCAPKKGFEEECTTDAECKESMNLICVEGKCSCNATESVYDMMHSQCVAKVGVSSTKFSCTCVRNANSVCYYGDYRSICQCSGGYTESEDGLCLGSYNSPCDPSSSPCMNDYTCINERCSCHFSTRQVYESGKCLSQVNGPCLETVRGNSFQYECRGQAECRNDTGIYQCLCKKGWIKSVGGVCKKAFGTSCSRDEECDQVERAKLICKEGMCSCGDYKEYDEDKSRCLGLVGADCDNSENSCVPGAACVFDRVGYGLCQCKPGMEVDSRRRCVKVLAGNGTTEVESATEEGIETQENVIIH